MRYKLSPLATFMSVPSIILSLTINIINKDINYSDIIIANNIRKAKK